MTRYLLALYRDYALPIPPEQTRQVWADVTALGDRLTDDGAFVFQGGINGDPESATVVRQSGGDFVLTDGPYTETKEHLAGVLDHQRGRPGRGPGVGQAPRPRNSAGRDPPALR